MVVVVVVEGTVVVSAGTSDVDVVGEVVVAGSPVVVGAVVSGTRTAGTSSVGGGGSGRTARYSTSVATNTPESTKVDVRGRPVTVALTGLIRPSPEGPEYRLLGRLR